VIDGDLDALIQALRLASQQEQDGG